MLRLACIACAVALVVSNPVIPKTFIADIKMEVKNLRNTTTAQFTKYEKPFGDHDDCMAFDNFTAPNPGFGILFRNDRDEMVEIDYNNDECRFRHDHQDNGCLGGLFQMFSHAKATQSKCGSGNGSGDGTKYTLQHSSTGFNMTFCVEDTGIPLALHLETHDERDNLYYHFEKFDTTTPPDSVFERPSFCHNETVVNKYFDANAIVSNIVNGKM
eukprot:NODE_4080_length_818_cov_49.374819_g4057_i0.p1 GENE.NODE_4080_length_818_cov_49.374819_g4057_i0~~NODE_4080_length_818_cov_49.374819_g4057_i0.p1  ORF type:complete len:214 (-),score=64.16 NODE_4080_length_818_cov_49.374819_g4057_i0:102-743(-)